MKTFRSRLTMDETMQKHDKEFWDKHIWVDISHGVLTTRGKGFSIELDVVTESKINTFERVEPLFGKAWDKWHESDVQHPSTIHVIDDVLSTLPTGITYAKEKRCFLDEREGRPKLYPKTWYHYVVGYRITITVSENRSLQLYKDRYEKIGVPFRDKLLREHRALLKELWLEFRAMVTVNSCGVWSDFHEREGKSYNQLGMKNLNSIAECYGLVLALCAITDEKMTEVAQEKSYIDIFESERGLEVRRIECKVDKPSLKSW